MHEIYFSMYYGLLVDRGMFNNYKSIEKIEEDYKYFMTINDNMPRILGAKFSKILKQYFSGLFVNFGTIFLCYQLKISTQPHLEPTVG